MVLMYHATFKSRLIPLRIVYFGYVGVDIFIIASAMGCYYSLTSDPDPIEFMKRRCKRLLPPYYAFLLIWLITFASSYKLSEIFPLFFCTYGGGLPIMNWYFSGMWLYYTLLIFFVPLVQRTERKIYLFAIFVVLLLYTITTWIEMNDSRSVGRLPVLFIGTCMGKLEKRKFVFQPCHYIPMFLLMIMGYSAFYFRLGSQKWPNICWGRYYGLLVSPGLTILCLNTLAFMGKIRYFRWIIQLLKLTGEYSFEILLAHFFVQAVAKFRPSKFSDMFDEYCLLFCFSPFLAVFIRFLAQKLLRFAVFIQMLIEKEEVERS